MHLGDRDTERKKRECVYLCERLCVYRIPGYYLRFDISSHPPTPSIHRLWFWAMFLNFLILPLFFGYPSSPTLETTRIVAVLRALYLFSRIVVASLLCSLLARTHASYITTTITITVGFAQEGKGQPYPRREDGRPFYRDSFMHSRKPPLSYRLVLSRPVENHVLLYLLFLDAAPS